MSQTPQLTEAELARHRETRRDYRNTFMLQAAILVVALFARDVLQLAGLSHVTEWTWDFFLLLEAGYLYLLWDLQRNFTSSRLAQRLGLAVIVAVFVTTLLVNQTGWLTDNGRRHANAVLHLLVFAIQLLVMRSAVMDMFQSPRNTSDKLWGSACIYFMGGFTFASLYHAIHLTIPDAFGPGLRPDHQAFAEALYYSFNCLVGLDTAYPAATRLVRNLTVLEGCWGQLYLVLLIGRVLMPPEGLDTPTTTEAKASQPAQPRSVPAPDAAPPEQPQ